CEYRHFRGAGHHIFGECPRERSDFLAVKSRVLAKHASRLSPDALARAVDTLRAELVMEKEERAAGLRELASQQAELLRLQSDLDDLARAHESLSRERFALEERYHALNGETEGLREDTGRLRAEAQRLYDQENALRTNLQERDDHLRRTYAEIERLNGLVRDMEGTRAWRLHQWVQARKSR
ncbi:MAG TPA: hypothetical protein VFR31_11620, partial [Thermoanaerobaculia bacterium]|nr:hypothetical protein [Thermoanaerobaculia bacterium]